MINCTELKGFASTANRSTIYVGNTNIKNAVSTIPIVAKVFGLPGNILVIHAGRSRKQMQNARNHFIFFFDFAADSVNYI